MIMTKSRIGIGIMAAIIAISGVSCNMTKKYEREEKEKIQNYITEHPEYDFVLKESGLYYADVVIGTGIHAATHDTAYVKYTGKYLDNRIFETNVSIDDTLIFPINEGWLNLVGFDEGITYMNEGGEAIFLIPSSIGYGNAGYYMPAWTPVLFEVNLVKIEPHSGK